MLHKPKPHVKNIPGRHWSEPGFLLPAVEAGIIQFFALALIYVVLWLVESTLKYRVSIGLAVLLLGGVAAIMTWFRRLPIWWLPIQFFFPIAIIMAYSMAFSPAIYLGFFLLFLLIYWTPYKTRVPLYLSGKVVSVSYTHLTLPTNREV